MSHSNCKAHRSPAAPVRTLLQHIVTKWHGLPLLCNYCCHPIDGSSVSESEQIGWCPNCQRAFRASLFRIPGWVAGIVMVLVITAQIGY
jgi:hypothetical protein